jgi:hypothetical protein
MILSSSPPPPPKKNTLGFIPAARRWQSAEANALQFSAFLPSPNDYACASVESLLMGRKASEGYVDVVETGSENEWIAIQLLGNSIAI